MHERGPFPPDLLIPEEMDRVVTSSDTTVRLVSPYTTDEKIFRASRDFYQRQTKPFSLRVAPHVLREVTPRGKIRVVVFYWDATWIHGEEAPTAPTQEPLSLQ